jgi:hypothetical protein
MRSAISKISAFSALLLLCACESTTQATSGRDWLAAHPPQSVDMTPGNIDQAVRDAAAVEPILRFPAKIGIARLEHGQLSAIPSDEGKAWTETVTHLGGSFGEFVPISPFIAAMLEPARDYRDPQINGTRRAVEDIRLAAARQHLDAVLIYETDATDNMKSNPLSLAEWTLIGAFVLPSENVRAEGIAQAILLDVRNGYPYGTLQASVDDTTSAARFDRDEARVSMKDKVRVGAVEKLTSETEAMIRKLQPQLAALDKKPQR